MGKGSKRRPCLIPIEEYYKNWDEIFGKRDGNNKKEFNRKEKKGAKSNGKSD